MRGYSETIVGRLVTGAPVRAAGRLDKEEAIRRLFADGWSTKRIADRVGVGPAMVNAVKRTARA